MTVLVEHVAMLAVQGLPPGGQLELPDGADVDRLLERIGVPDPFRHVVAPFINGRRGQRTTVLQDGDQVFLSLPVGGG